MPKIFNKVDFPEPEVLCQIFWVGGVQPGGVVLCILLFNTPVESYVSYAVNRIVDTAVGVLVALLINSLIPRDHLPQWLFFWRRSKPEAEEAAQAETHPAP